MAERNTKAENFFKARLGVDECFIRGDSVIVKDTVNPKLYHFAQSGDNFVSTNLGIKIDRQPVTYG